ncbi:MAG: undecaprenyl-diphosphate phosphatase [Candidatus Dojkabacteria bacterium]|nr:MAG: undecaprenyl-diphosphate phosphatase [Candidatus Dojkabacteria bacterium]
MNLLYLLLNIVQGITEFLPISSSGHLIIIEHIAAIDAHGLEAFLHLPTVFSIGFLFWQELLEIAKNPKQWPAVIVAIIPAGIIGLLFSDVIDMLLYSPIIIGVSQLFWGFVMAHIAHKAESATFITNKTDKITLKQALFIGAGQVLALIPGTSRSGITTMSGIVAGVTPQTSAKFSFIIGFPLLTAAAGVGLVKLITSGSIAALGIAPWALFIGFALSFFLGIGAMWLFTSSNTTKVMKYSAFYRILVGIFILLWLI